MKLIRIATRQSPLALWQAEFVAAELRARHPGLRTELIKITTRGDKIIDSPLSKVGGKGLFVKELEQSLQRGEADIAVHSMKDVPMAFPEGLHLPVIMQREDPGDAFVANDFDSIRAMPAGALVGTSSLRRQTQLRAQFPQLQITSLRGNVGTRLSKLDDGAFQAIILAAAGLKRLGLNSRITQTLAYDECLPAVGQGAMGIETRINDDEVEQLIEPLNHADTACCVRAERAMNNKLQGGCQVPIAGFAVLEPKKQLWLRGLVGSPDGGRVIASDIRGDATDPEALGIALAEDLLDRGAGEILSAIGAATF